MRFCRSLGVGARCKVCSAVSRSGLHISGRLSTNASLRTSELPRRLGATLVLLGLVRAGHFIPVIEGTRGVLLSDNAFSIALGGGGLVASVFSLGIAPLMSAYFALAAASLIPPLKRHFAALREQGPQGQEIYQTYVSVLFVLFASWEAFHLARHWLHAQKLDLPSAPLEGLLQAAGPAGPAAQPLSLTWVVVLLTAGAAICKLASQLIQHSGFGEGAGVIISLGVAVSLVALSLCAQSVELKIPIVFYRPERFPLLKKERETISISFNLIENASGNRAPADRTEPHASASEQGHSFSSFPFRLCPTGARSLLFSTFWARLLKVPCSWYGMNSPFESALGFAFLVFFTEAVALPDLTSTQLSGFLSRNNVGIPGHIPGHETRTHLAVVRHRIKLLNAAFLASLSLAARAVDSASITLVGIPVDCLSLLLISGTLGAMARQVNAMFTTRAAAFLLARYQCATS